MASNPWQSYQKAYHLLLPLFAFVLIQMASAAPTQSINHIVSRASSNDASQSQDWAADTGNGFHKPRSNSVDESPSEDWQINGSNGAEPPRRSTAGALEDYDSPHSQVYSFEYTNSDHR